MLATIYKKEKGILICLKINFELKPEKQKFINTGLIFEFQNSEAFFRSTFNNSSINELLIFPDIKKHL